MSQGSFCNIKRIFFTFIILLYPVLSACDSKTTDKTWVFGIDTGENVIRIENHSDALLYYLKAGYKNRIVIHIDAHDDSRFIENSKIKEIKKLASGKDYKILKEKSGISYSSSPKLFNIGNFLYAAYKLGVVKEVYWVLPATATALSNITAENVKKYLRRVGFNEESANTFRKTGGCIRGSRNGLPIVLCAQSDIPEIHEPALISLDIDYLPAFYKNPVKTPMLDTFLRLYNNLKKQHISTDSVIISYSVNGETTPLMHKYVGDYFYASIKDPSIINNAIPPVWKHRANALQKRHKGLYKDSIEELNKAIALDPGNASLYYDLAIVHLYLKDLDNSLAVLKTSISKDPAYFLGFVEIGELIENNRFYDFNTAVKFVASAYKLVPKNSKAVSHITLGIAYFQNKAFRKAQIEYGKAIEFMMNKEH